MAAVAGMASLYDLPNFVGQLHKVTSEDTVLLSMAGGLSGGDEVGATDVPFTTVDNTDAAQPAILDFMLVGNGGDDILIADVSNDFNNFHEYLKGWQ